ncbi:hypothetical protein THAOC_24446, partial [Thalassiosira oceanica]
MRQELHRHAETEYAREARLQADRANKESKREAETEDARTLRLQDQAHRQDLLRQTETEDARTLRLHDQAHRQQCMRDNIITSETAENRVKRLQNEARRKKASRAMSPVRSQDSSDSDVVMEDVDSSSSDESSDESMNDNIQMTRARAAVSRVEKGVPLRPQPSSALVNVEIRHPPSTWIADRPLLHRLRRQLSLLGRSRVISTAQTFPCRVLQVPDDTCHAVVAPSFGDQRRP